MGFELCNGHGRARAARDVGFFSLIFLGLVVGGGRCRCAGFIPTVGLGRTVEEAQKPKKSGATHVSVMLVRWSIWALGFIVLFGPLISRASPKVCEFF